MTDKRECKAIESLLDRFLDGELTQAEQQRVKVELATCDDCRQRLERLQKLRALVREVYVEEARVANLDPLLSGVMNKVRREPGSWTERLRTWFDKYRLGLASPVAPVGVAATLAVVVMAATLIALSGRTPTPAGKGSPASPAVASGEETPGTSTPGGEASPAGEKALASSRPIGQRRPAHEEKPFHKNECYITYYQVESGIVIVDVDPEGEAPAVVWHFPEEEADPGAPAQEDNRI